MATRPDKPGIVTPPSPGLGDNQLVTSKKRKRIDASDGYDRRTLVAKPYPNTSGPQLSFDLVCVVQRSTLPLAWLNTAPTSTVWAFGNLFQLDGQAGQFDSSLILVVKLEAGLLVALEHLERHVYIAADLAIWVTEEHLGAVARGETISSLLEHLLDAQHTASQQTAHKLPSDDLLTTKLPSKKPRLKKGALARMSILPRKKTDGAGTALPLQLKSGAVTLEDEAHNASDKDAGESNSAQALMPQAQSQGSSDLQSLVPHTEDAESVLDKLHLRYLETLYISKTSVAYFAKGPLARARAAFSTCTEPAQNPLQLAQYYRDSIIPLKRMDAKYKDAIVACIWRGENGNASPPSKRKKSKRKLGKDGFYPDEPEYVLKCWENHGSSSSGATSEASMKHIKTLSTDLRTRETQLQILIILEAMILEFPSDTPIKRECAEPDLKHIPTKKRQDLKTHLDLLVDRLCIWHTVLFEQITENKAVGKKTNDKLRDFCVEVIVPFYATKLPEQCRALSKKLGGPTDLSPKRPRIPLTKSASTSKVMPGAEVERRPQMSKLQRVLSEDQSRPPSRASSMSVKEEPNERPVSRGALQKARLLQNRQVDLVAIARQQESKVKKRKSMAEQKEQLDAAINMLRKPNRGIAARSFAEEVEKRQDTNSGSRSAKRLGRSSSQLGLQVAATPRKKQPGESQEIEVKAVHEVIAVPSSTVRPPSLPLLAFGSSTEGTPSRGPMRKTNPLALPSKNLLPPSNPLLAATPTKGPRPTPPVFVAATPTAQRSTRPLATITNTPLTANMRKSQKRVQFTPLKKTDSVEMDVFADAPEVKKTSRNEDDIYATLGWMDDGFDL